VRGYREESTTTTPFDMVVLNHLDRYQLGLDAMPRIPRFSTRVEQGIARYWTTMERHKLHIGEQGDDMPETRTGGGRGRDGKAEAVCARRPSMNHSAALLVSCSRAVHSDP
jgi:XFP C-terminal domain